MLRDRGLSLLEIVLSVSLLGGTFLLFSTVVLTAFGNTAGAGETVELLAEAERQLNELEELAERVSWSDFLLENGVSKEVRGFQVDTSVRELSLFTPSRSAEEAFLSQNTARTLDDTAGLAEVVVTRGSARTRQSRLIGRGRRQLANPAIEFRGLPATILAKDSRATISAHLVDVDGNEIPAFFQFSLVPLTGNGTFEVSRNGREVSLTNVYQSNGLPRYTGGSCRLKARAVYFGREYIRESSEVQLAE